MIYAIIEFKLLDLIRYDISNATPIIYVVDSYDTKDELIATI